MIRQISYRVAVFALVAVVFGGVGCAKKNKSDNPVDAEKNGLAARDSVVDKDMDFAAAGSDAGKIVGLYSVRFEYDRSSLTQSDRELLVKDAQWLKAHPDKSLQIEGHCDRHGSTEYNLALGERRAQAVKRYLLNLGAETDRLSVISYGKEKLLDLAENDEADVKNRRANFKPIDAPRVKRLSQR